LRKIDGKSFRRFEESKRRWEKQQQQYDRSALARFAAYITIEGGNEDEEGSIDEEEDEEG
jgi:hypothetical protein